MQARQKQRSEIITKTIARIPPRFLTFMFSCFHWRMRMKQGSHIFTYVGFGRHGQLGSLLTRTVTESKPSLQPAFLIISLQKLKCISRSFSMSSFDIVKTVVVNTSTRICFAAVVFPRVCKLRSLILILPIRFFKNRSDSLLLSF